uniref:Uncharacterized protein n=1 Tax=Anguilla anguilla TaxID=7936 RepID=A0A0E9TKD0_ANGAN
MPCFPTERKCDNIYVSWMQCSDRKKINKLLSA